nr:helix-turn-helix domain-containing protein [Serratia quinivorans]
MKRATKVRLYPTTEQEAFLNAQFGAVRFAYICHIDGCGLRSGKPRRLRRGAVTESRTAHSSS